MRSAVPGKARVHELAKELGVDSKTVLAKLKEMGEFVKSASSTVEAPVARRLRGALDAPGGAAPAAAAPAATEAPSAPSAPRANPSAMRPQPPRRPAAPSVGAPTSVPTSSAPSPGSMVRPKPPVPGRPGPVPGPVAKPASAHDIEVAAAEARASALKAEQDAAVKAAQAARTRDAERRAQQPPADPRRGLPPVGQP